MPRCGMLALRVATPDDLALVFPRTRALNDHEGIDVSDAVLEAALARLLADPSLGSVWLVTRGATPIGYAIVTYSYDLEFGGREGWLTELWIDHAARGTGAGAAALELLATELAARGLGAVHLQVRGDNPAKRLYDRTGFVASPRTIMTRRL